MSERRPAHPTLVLLLLYSRLRKLPQVSNVGLDTVNVLEDRPPVGCQLFELDGHLGPGRLIVVLGICWLDILVSWTQG